MARKVETKRGRYEGANGHTALLDGGTAKLRVSRVATAMDEDAEMQHLSQEIARLVEASRQGRLDERGKTDQFQGAHRDVVQGINEMLDAILLPIGEGNRILAQISAAGSTS